MGGFSSLADIKTAIAHGKYRDEYFRKLWVKSSTQDGAGLWAEYFSATGNPGAISFSGTAGVATILNSSTSGALLPLAEGDVSPQKRFLIDFQVWTAESTIHPGVVILADLLLYYPSISNSTTETTLSNSNTLSRYTDGKGVLGISFTQTTSGAAAHTQTFTFTADDNSSQTGVLIAPANSLTAGTLKSTSQTVGASSPFIPISGGKQGIKKIDSYNTDSGGTTGTCCVVLLKPLVVAPITAQYLPVETEYISQFPNPIEIKDGACLGIILLHGSGSNLANNAAIRGRLRYGWN